METMNGTASNKLADLLVRLEAGGVAACHHRFMRWQCLEVRDLSTRSVIHIRAEQISPYRHTLLLDGTAYQILDVSCVP